jgi:hypothetical protein
MAYTLKDDDDDDDDENWSNASIIQGTDVHI